MDWYNQSSAEQPGKSVAAILPGPKPRTDRNRKQAIVLFGPVRVKFRHRSSELNIGQILSDSRGRNVVEVSVLNSAFRPTVNRRSVAIETIPYLSIHSMPLRRVIFRCRLGEPLAGSLRRRQRTLAMTTVPPLLWV